MTQNEVYQMVTDQIIAQLEAGVVPWHQPWVGGSAMAISYEKQKPYSMLNQLLLGKPGEWITWKQVQAHGGTVRKGAKSRLCVFYEHKEAIEKNEETGEEKKNEYFILKWYKVFHLDDVEGITSKIEKIEPNELLEPVDLAEGIVNGYLLREKELTFVNNHPSGKAYYSPATDTVVVPMLSQYAEVDEYYSTAFHELTHSTGKKSRCDREDEKAGSRFGNQAYSREELVAEIGAAMLCNTAGLDSEKAFKNSVAYINGWKSRLKEDNRAIIWAASRAEKAAKYILNDTTPASNSNNNS